ncbi:hypothetical protein [Acetobacteroides hydrogenigenes]|uniref:Uncharacterized protein n=1 Tax=Acetobacteroides hydrogenigenes TaxID=979970 RepID=A0A4R2EPS7_9BACT|nr:hypothetical protein [Acetobacteroides hydrogenigenes]TCN68584.1 hypothetical protein CLV25_106166 [Acetobacteroides hydrogenigenes]
MLMAFLLVAISSINFVGSLDYFTLATILVKNRRNVFFIVSEIADSESKKVAKAAFNAFV